MIAAILRAQLLSMRIGASRGALFSAITAVVWYGLWTVVAAAIYVAALHAESSELAFYLPLAFLAVCAYWQLIPILSASIGSGLDMRKLLVYPAPHGKLFAVEVLLRLVTGAEMVLVLSAGTAGLLRNPAAGWAALPGLLSAVLLFVAFNVLAASGMRSLLERLLARRRVREFLGFFLLMLYVLPRVLYYSGSRAGKWESTLARLELLGFPWTAAAHAGLPIGAAESRWLALLSLAGWTLLALWFGRAQFERNLRFDAVAAQATPLREGASRAGVWKDRFYRVPSLLWRDPLAGIVEKELRSLARTPRFRMVFIMGFTFGLAVWFPMIAGRRTRLSSGNPHYFLIIVCIYALTLLGQVSYWNCFGFDRSAAAIYFVAPQPLLFTLLGKNLASLFFVYLEVLVLCGITAALGLASGWSTIVETVAVVGICSLYLLGIGNLSSVHYPRGLSPERVSQGGASSRFQGLIFLLYPLALIPVFLAYVARWALRSQAAFVLMLAIAAIIGGVVYWLAMESAVNTAGRRRERILQELSKGEGPVATE